jgi:UDP-2,3-diacylglucosamine pyrophosphatase LpxH
MTHYRAIWISDVHLGTSGCQANYLLDFLKHNEADKFYLVGDIIDGWKLKRSFYWPQAHNDVVQKLLRKARKGAEVIYIPGNHDEAARQYFGMSFGDIQVQEEVIHTTLDGRKLWVTHGDLFDGVMQYAKWLAYVGDSMYSFILYINRYFNMLRIKMGLQYWSLSQYLKHQVKNAVSYIADFEHIMAREARLRNCDGVVCGHIHKAEIREIACSIAMMVIGLKVFRPWLKPLPANSKSFIGHISKVIPFEHQKSLYNPLLKHLLKRLPYENYDHH